MEEDLYVARRTLRQLLVTHPHWALDQFAAACNQSVSWVKKWKARFRAAAVPDDSLLWGLSRARKTSPPPTDPRLVDRILAIRDTPPENLHRTPGPKAILYYLPCDPVVRELGLRPIRSTRRIWQILDAHQRILRPTKRQLKEAAEQPKPYTEFQIDFKDVGTVEITPGGKKQHVIEILNVVDVGTSIIHAAIPRPDFAMATVIESLAALFTASGVLPHLTFDRNPRFVGAWTAHMFPSAFLRFLYALHIVSNICPPHRPDLNGHVERMHKSLGQECIAVAHPADLAAVQACLTPYVRHYNEERPNQAVTCGNRPPRVAFPDLPALPALPRSVNPDAWLTAIHGQSYPRRITPNGSVRIGGYSYYVQKTHAGHRVAVQVAAPTKELIVLHKAQTLKRLAVKGLHAKELTFEAYVPLIIAEAQREQRQHRFAA